MDTERNKIQLSSTLYQLLHKRGFWMTVIAILVFGLILAFIFSEAPIAGESQPIPGYP
jgi:hypothetical protein